MLKPRSFSSPLSILTPLRFLRVFTDVERDSFVRNHEHIANWKKTPANNCCANDIHIVVPPVWFFLNLFQQSITQTESQKRRKDIRSLFLRCILYAGAHLSQGRADRNETCKRTWRRILRVLLQELCFLLSFLSPILSNSLGICF